jgi:hypothetical protein
MLAVRKDYAAPTGLGNWVARVATKISLRTELRTGVPKLSAGGVRGKRVTMGKIKTPATSKS